MAIVMRLLVSDFVLLLLVLFLSSLVIGLCGDVKDLSTL